jgi:hypothetical protein
MATRIQSPVVRRSSLPLTEQNEEDLSKVRSSSSYQRALEVLSGRKIVEADVSTSALLHAIFEAGMAAVQKEAEIAGYAEIALSQSAKVMKEHRVQSRRRRPTWAQEV